MYQKILLPLEAGRVPDVVVRHVMALAAAHGAVVSALRIIPVVSSGEAFFDKIQTEPGSRGAKLHDEAQAEFKRLERLGQDAGVAVSGEAIFTEKAEADAIVAYATERGFHLIVMTTRPRAALSRWLMGNVEDKVRRRSPIPVLFVPVEASADA